MDALLAFHGIDGSGSVLSYAPDDFERLLDGLQAEGVAVVALDELLASAANRAGATAAAHAGAPHRVALTFDDGFTSVHAEALPRLARRKLPFTVYAVADWIGRDNRWPTQTPGIPRFPLMAATQLRELGAAGATIGGHTATHADCRGLDAAALRRELVDSKETLQQLLQQEVRHFAWPYGRFDATADAALRPHWSSAVTTRLAYLPPPAARDVHALPRLDSWYLRAPERRLPLFSTRTRAWIAWRRALRAVKGAAYGT